MPNQIGKFVNDVAGGFFGNDYLRDFTHAAKTFRGANYQNAPKFKFLFHVYFDLNGPAPHTAESNVSTNFGLLVKNVKLPSFTFMTSEMNQYNRKRLIQTKIKYDPIDITFHDDNRNLIASLWYQYYTYYYNDASLLKDKVFFSGNRGGRSTSTSPQGGGVTAPATAASYNTRTQYTPSIVGDDNWGYVGESNSNNNNPTASSVKLPYFNKITIFGMSQHNFIAYTLVNPIISKFNHDTYDYEQGNGIMQNSMSIEYETVVYNQGSLDGMKPSDIITGFGDKANYDTRLSPIATPGSNSNILGKGGLIDSAGGAITQLVTDPVSAIKTAGAIYNSAKNINLTSQLSAELTRGLQNALQGSDNPTRQKLVDIPIASATPTTQPTQNIGNPTDILNNVTTAATNLVTGTTSAITGAIGTITKYAGGQNTSGGKTAPPPIAPTDLNDFYG